MKHGHGKSKYAFRAPFHCTECGRERTHACNVISENETTVHNIRTCSGCGARTNFWSPVSVFKLFAAGALTATCICLYLGVNPLNYF